MDATDQNSLHVRLPSVGCVIDLATGLIHPEQVDGLADWFDGMAVPISDVSDEWIAALSETDRECVEAERAHSTIL